jgi:hypothetical protein
MNIIERAMLIAALREIEAICSEDNATFRKRGGTRAGLSLVVAREALKRIAPIRITQLRDVELNPPPKPALTGWIDR